MFDPSNLDPREYYIANDVTLEQLANIYDGIPGCTLSGLRNRCHKEKWTELRKQFKAQAAKQSRDLAVGKIAESASEEIKNYYERVLRLRNRVLTELEAPRILDRFGNPMPHPMDPMFARGVKLNPIYKKTWDEGLLILREQGDGDMPTMKEFCQLPEGVSMDEI